MCVVSSPVNVVLRFKHTETILPQSCDVVIVISIALRRYQLGPWHSCPQTNSSRPPSCCWRPQMALMFFVQLSIQTTSLRSMSTRRLFTREACLKTWREYCWYYSLHRVPRNICLRCDVPVTVTPLSYFSQSASSKQLVNVLVRSDNDNGKYACA